MTPPIWLDAIGRPRPTPACWTCGREVASMRFRGADLRRQGWSPPQTLQIPDWCGCSREYLPVPAGDGWWVLVPIWDPVQTPNPLRAVGTSFGYWHVETPTGGDHRLTTNFTIVPPLNEPRPLRR
jgi:hypothetical protein